MDGIHKIRMHAIKAAFRSICSLRRRNNGKIAAFIKRALRNFTALKKLLLKRKADRSPPVKARISRHHPWPGPNGSTSTGSSPTAAATSRKLPKGSTSTAVPCSGNWRSSPPISNSDLPRIRRLAYPCVANLHALFIFKQLDS